MTKIIKVYCEGKKGSPDFEILQKVFEGLPGDVMIKPIGGKRGAKSIIQFQELTGVDKADFYLFFRDRDFDIAVPENAELTIAEKYVCFSYRTTIENYLLSPNLFLRFIQEKNTKVPIEASPESVTQLFETAAKRILSYQAVRHALGSLRNGNASFGTTWTEHSGELPEKLDRDYCHTQALDLITRAREAASEWNEKVLEERIRYFIEKFDNNFVKRGDYMIWFQGKDFISSLKLDLKGFPFNLFIKFACENFDYTMYPDLMQLRNNIEKQFTREA